MAKNTKLELNVLTVSKDDSFKDHKVVTGLDETRDKEFNEGKTIEVTLEEFEKIKHYRWLKWQ
ncbi:MAG: hypothetical protein IPJ03_17615 [Ignavibacteriales bacterium]|nr:hypothetical protein [Ignavibacteriales bacterium]MBK7380407.1 hypothetical protein [Ignavibacteriales bacterium]MBK7380753.1 hypothetical protein [Ignavibacteriales bacterium]MBK7380779.1 hypothetical protein [Ignavibacteriales bacterium]